MKILIVGLGGVGQRHARNLRTLLSDRVELLAYRVRGLHRALTPTLEVDAGKDVERELGIQAFADIKDALACRPMAALICNPTALHIETALACVNAGCDLFVEKPLSNSLAGVDELIDAVERTRRVAMVGYHFRFHPCLKTLTEVIAGRSLGQLLSVRAIIGEHLPSWHPYEDYRESYAARADLGGGVVLTQIHELDYLYSLFGTPKSVYAIGGHWSHLAVDVEDVASMLMEATVDGRALPIHVHQDYVQAPAVRQCEVIGDTGKATLDFRGLTVTVHRYGCDPIVHAFPTFERNQAYLDEMRHFLDCVEHRTRPVVDLRDGAESLRIALAVKQSMASGRPVALSPPADHPRQVDS